MAQAKVLDRKVFYAGTKIFDEGDPGDRAYLIQEGSVRISKGAAILANLGPGELFGEMALIDAQPRMASASAVENTTVVVINQATFQDKLAKADPFLRALLNMFVRNLRAVSERR